MSRPVEQAGTAQAEIVSTARGVPAAPRVPPDRRHVTGLSGLRRIELLFGLQLGAAAGASALALLLLLQAAGVWRAPGVLVALAAVLGATCALGFVAVLFELTTDVWLRLNLFSRRRIQRRVGFPLAVGILALAAAAAVAGEASRGAAALALGLLLLATLAFAWMSTSLLRSTVGYRHRREKLVDTWRSCLPAPADPAGAEVSRVRAFVAGEAGDDSGHAYSTIRGFAVPGLYSAPFHPNERFDWIPAVEAAFPEIRAEILAALDAHDDSLRPYPFVGNGRWRELAFYKGGTRIDEHCALCPTTARIVEEVIPGGTVREAMVSVLEPGGHIPPHLDHAVPMLTCHLGLVVPPNCGIRVGNETRPWEEGRCLVLDTAYEHEAWNASGKRRAILLVDFWPPDLSGEERAFFARAFQKTMRSHLKAT